VAHGCCRQCWEAIEAAEARGPEKVAAGAAVPVAAGPAPTVEGVPTEEATLQSASVGLTQPDGASRAAGRSAGGASGVARQLGRAALHLSSFGTSLLVRKVARWGPGAVHR
jgi:hypothetical protein